MKQATLAVIAFFLITNYYCWCIEAIKNNANKQNFRIKILHSNDLHARFEEVSQDAGVCSKDDSSNNKCYGGFARVATVVKKSKAQNANGVQTLFFDSGDTFEGSYLYQIFKVNITTRMLNILGPDAATLGNHEFDGGVDGLLPYLRNSSHPIVVTNLDWSQEPNMTGNTNLKKSHIMEVDGRKIGVLGYLTPSTKKFNMVGQVKFLDEIDSLRKEIRKLRSQGINIFVALGHSGYQKDIEIAEKVEDLDLILGGHTHTFLYGKGPMPDSEVSAGDYPTIVAQPFTKRRVYVTQAYAYSKYLGNLTVDFDDSGEIVGIFGKPILLDSKVEQDKDVLVEIEKWKSQIPPADDPNRVVGLSKVVLDGYFMVCRVAECNLGNLITDAMVDYRVRSYSQRDGWTDAPIAVMNAGNIRTSVPRKTHDEVTHQDLESAYPYGDNMIMVDVSGKTILKALEWGIRDSETENTTTHGGGFLQVSGLEVAYDLSKPPFSRVASVKVRCGLCDVPTLQKLQIHESYRIVMTDYLHQGGDGFHMFSSLNSFLLNTTTLNAIEQYVNLYSPIYPEVQGRIKYVK